MKNKTYKFKCEVVDEDDEVMIESTTSVNYESIGAFGDCESIDETVGKMLRHLVQKVEARESLQELDAQLLEDVKERDLALSTNTL